MQQNLSVEKLFIFLQARGFSEDKIADIGVQLTRSAFMLLYTNAVAVFTEEDIKAIEDAEIERQANEKIVELYALRIGKDPQEQVNVFLTKVAEDYMAELEKEPVKHGL